MSQTIKDIKILSASEVRNQHLLVQLNFVQQDFQKVLEQVIQNLYTALDSITTNTLVVVLPEFYRDHAKLAKTLASKLVVFFQEKKFKIIDLPDDHLSLTIQWRSPEDLLSELFTDSKDMGTTNELTIENLNASFIRRKQIFLHQQPLLHELVKLKEQVINKIQEAQSRFQEECVLNLEDCRHEYTKFLLHYMLQELESNKYHVTIQDGTHLKLSWATGEDSDEEEETKIPCISTTISLPSENTQSSPLAIPVVESSPLPSQPESIEIDFSQWTNEKLVGELIRAGIAHSVQHSKESKFQVVIYHNEVLKRMKEDLTTGK
jgi:hypothetical protein